MSNDNDIIVEITYCDSNNQINKKIVCKNEINRVKCLLCKKLTYDTFCENCDDKIIKLSENKCVQYFKRIEL